MNDISVPGIPVADTEIDLWARLRRRVTVFNSTGEEEEAIFEEPIPLSFERPFETMQRTEEILVDVKFPGKVSPMLEALGADDSLLKTETSRSFELVAGIQPLDGNYVNDRT